MIKLPFRIIKRGFWKDLIAISIVAMISEVKASDKEIKIESFEAYPTFESIGLRFGYEGDVDSNAVTDVHYRMKGTSGWNKAQSLTRILGNRFAGSIFFLKSQNDPAFH